MAKHKHAELMMQYAQDAMETDKPWERWQVWSPMCSEWKDCISPLHWYQNAEYRRKPRTININGYEVPEPAREPLQVGEVYYTPFGGCGFPSLAADKWVWAGDNFDTNSLQLGIVHLTEEAAELHAKALLSFTTPVAT